MATKLKLESSLLLLVIFLVFSQAEIGLSTPKPQILDYLKIENNQVAGRSCSYRVSITTSCSSPSFTRDMISLAFGDAHGYQVYVPRLDDLYSRAFERCSTDTYQVSGPCLYGICYLYLSRTGPDGWMPESITVSGHNIAPTTFYYNTFLPYRTWFGFNFCNSKPVVASG